jgi:hypothetical protein
MDLANLPAVTARTALVDKRLYKYRSLADDKQKARIKDILVNHRIRFSRLSELNDPIEGKPILQLGDWSSSDYRAHFEEWVYSTQRHMVNVPPKDAFIRWVRSLTKDHHEQYVQQINADNHAAIEARWRILSLSATPSQDQMWSHYSDGHSGLALVFDASHGEFGIAFKVHYVPERVPMDVTTQNLTEVLNATILTKRSTWAYEEEYRCIAAEQPEASLLHLEKQFMTFKPEQLVGIIFGAKTTQSDIDLIKGWIRDRPTRLELSKTVINAAGTIELLKNAL